MNKETIILSGAKTAVLKSYIAPKLKMQELHMAYTVMSISQRADDFGGEGTGGSWGEHGSDEGYTGKSQYRSNLWD